MYNRKLMEHKLKQENIEFEYEAAKLSYEPEVPLDENTAEDDDSYK